MQASAGDHKLFSCLSKQITVKTFLIPMERSPQIHILRHFYMNKVQAEHILNSFCGLGKEFPSMESIADGSVAKKVDWPWQASL
ncbi:hypothetical protein J1605_007438 [Eschrichtius robustus]|uniref:Uncharacterized protein n=1 Tax=Eschrichtius robustus TaxID=9764 RepID=A0AB34H0L0_ESCRO|nr:hypothetical protein J1605_007438 [Eschrichtius robustus]